MKRIAVLLLITFVTCWFVSVSSGLAVPLPPEMSLDKTGVSVEITWTPSTGADGYRRYTVDGPGWSKKSRASPAEWRSINRLEIVLKTQTVGSGHTDYLHYTFVEAGVIHQVFLIQQIVGKQRHFPYFTAR